MTDTERARLVLQLRGKVESLQRESDRASGQVQMLREQLRKEHGCDSVEEAEEKLASLQEEIDQLEEAFRAALAEFEADHGRLLE